MAEVTSGGVRLHVEVDGEGAPVTAIAHGLTNSCRELAMLTGLIDGTKVRFDFRGHGHSGAPEDPDAFTFADMAADLEAVAVEYGATRAIGTSMGAGAICNILCERPDRFERVVLLLPAGIDRRFTNLGRFQRYADALETLPKDEAIERILDDPDRLGVYLASPWLRDIDRTTWDDLADLPAQARAIRCAGSTRPCSSSRGRAIPSIRPRWRERSSTCSRTPSSSCWATRRRCSPRCRCSCSVSSSG
jgi:pimeloyl-ACP methyl ester carboxylesterase